MVRLHMGRLNVSVGGTATLSLMRDVIDRPQSPLQGGSNGTVEAHGAGATTRGVDCSPLSLWVRALHACETWHAVLRGDEPLDAWQGLPAEERVATLAYLTGGNASQQMHFHNVRIEGGVDDESPLRAVHPQRVCCESCRCHGVGVVWRE